MSNQNNELRHQLIAFKISSFMPGNSMENYMDPIYSYKPIGIAQEEDTTLKYPSLWSQPFDCSPDQLLGQPMGQKRQRVVRACDECRKKKTKCDGNLPCNYCTEYCYDCTYEQPTNRKRNPTLQYVEALENRLQRAEAELKIVCPGFDLDSAMLDASPKTSGRIPNVGAVSRDLALPNVAAVSRDLALPNVAAVSRDLALPHPDKKVNQSSTENEERAQDWQLCSMIRSMGRLDLERDGNRNYHGESSGIVYIRHMQPYFRGLLGDRQTPLDPSVYPQEIKNESSKPNFSLSHELKSCHLKDLPSHETATALSKTVFTQACPLLSFLHQPSFYEMMERTYRNTDDVCEDPHHNFLGLLFVTLALGSLFGIKSSYDTSESTRTEYKTRKDRGIFYFQLVRSCIDSTDCRDLTKLQTVIMMILFLQASENWSVCYSYIGIAQRSALQMGLHRNLTDNLNPIECETRRRVFWTIHNLDICISAMLGLPNLLQYDDIDQEMPTEVDDDCITKDEILPMTGRIAFLLQAANAHTRLMFTFAKILKFIYPKIENKGYSNKYSNRKDIRFVSHAKIKEIERELVQWLDNLPSNLQVNNNADKEIARVQRILHLCYGYVQLMLYRPFLLCASKSNRVKKSSCPSFSLALDCVKVSRKIIDTAREMNRLELLTGAYSFTMYATYFATLTLMCYFLENETMRNSIKIYQETVSGKKVLNELAPQSQAALSCSSALKALFEQMPQKLSYLTSCAITAQEKRTLLSDKELDIQKWLDLSCQLSINHDIIQPETIPKAVKNNMTSQTGSVRDCSGLMPVVERTNKRNPYSYNYPINSSNNVTSNLDCTGEISSQQQLFSYPHYNTSCLTEFESSSVAGHGSVSKRPITGAGNFNDHSNVNSFDFVNQNIKLSDLFHDKDKQTFGGSGAYPFELSRQYFPEADRNSSARPTMEPDNIGCDYNPGKSFYYEPPQIGLPTTSETSPADAWGWNNVPSAPNY